MCPPSATSMIPHEHTPASPYANCARSAGAPRWGEMGEEGVWATFSSKAGLGVCEIPIHVKGETKRTPAKPAGVCQAKDEFS
jgi:hypothetical protein